MLGNNSKPSPTWPNFTVFVGKTQLNTGGFRTSPQAALMARRLASLASLATLAVAAAFGAPQVGMAVLVWAVKIVRYP